jgi:hypothetical protein
MMARCEVGNFLAVHIGEIANYYRYNVIGGDGAFVVVADGFNSFGNAIVKKLIKEVAQTEPRQESLNEPH